MTTFSFHILQGDLQKALKTLKPDLIQAEKADKPRTINGIKQLTAASYLTIEGTTDTGLTLTAANGKIVSVVGKVDLPGVVTVPFRVFIEYVNLLPPERCDLTSDDTWLDTLRLECGRNKARFKGREARTTHENWIARSVASLWAGVPLKATSASGAQYVIVPGEGGNEYSRPFGTSIGGKEPDEYKNLNKLELEYKLKNALPDES